MKKINLDNFFKGYKKLSTYLLYLLPLTLITGPFLSDLSLSIIGFFFLTYSIKNKLWHYYKNPFVFLFSLFYLYLLFRSFFSTNIYYSLEACLFYFRYLFFSLGVFYLFKNNSKLAKNLGIIIFITLFIVLIDGYYQWIMGYNILGWTTGQRTDRLSSFFGEELVLGGYIARLIPIMFALLIYAHKSSINKVFIGILFLFFSNILVFGSGERAAFFFIILFNFMLIFISNKFKFYALINLFMTTLTIFLITIFVPNSNLRFQQTLDQTTNNLFIPFAPYSPLHEEHYIVALKIFADNPIFGKGPNMFDILCLKEKYYYSAGGCTNHPHNSYIQLLAETGIIGFLFLFSSFVIISVVLLRQFLGLNKILKFNIPEFIVMFLLSIFIMTWPLIPTGSFFNNWTNVMHYLPVGFILYYFYDKKEL